MADGSPLTIRRHRPRVYLLLPRLVSLVRGLPATVGKGGEMRRQNRQHLT